MALSRILAMMANHRDPYWNYVALLLHGDGANASTTITDSSKNHRSITAVNGAQISTAQSKFGGSSIDLSAAGAYLNAASLPGLGAGDFTVEAWIYLVSGTGTPILISTETDGVTGGQWNMQVDSGKPDWYDAGVGHVVDAGSLPTSAWHFWAASRNSGQFRMFVDGVQVGTTATYALTLPQTAAQAIGGTLASGAAGAPPLGYIDELRVTIGVGRYAANFTPPTTAFPNG